MFLGFLWRRTSAIGVFAGILAGYVALLLPAVADIWKPLLPEWDRGLVAMLLNALVTIAVSTVLPDRSRPDTAGSSVGEH